MEARKNQPEGAISYPLPNLFNGTHWHYGKYSPRPEDFRNNSKTAPFLRRLPTTRFQRITCIALLTVVSLQKLPSSNTHQTRCLACIFDKNFFLVQRVFQSLVLEENLSSSHSEMSVSELMHNASNLISVSQLLVTQIMIVSANQFSGRQIITYFTISRSNFNAQHTISLVGPKLLENGISSFFKTHYVYASLFDVQKGSRTIYNNIKQNLYGCFYNIPNKTETVSLHMNEEFVDLMEFKYYTHTFLLFPKTSYEIVTCGRKNTKVFNILGYFSFFDSIIWFLLLVSVFIESIVLCLLCSEEKVKVISFLNTFLDLLISFATVVSHEIVKRKLFYFTWIFPILVLNVYYSCFVTEISTAPLLPDSPKNLIESLDNNFTVHMLNMSAGYKHIEAEQHPLFKLLYNMRYKEMRLNHPRNGGFLADVVCRSYSASLLQGYWFSHPSGSNETCSSDEKLAVEIYAREFLATFSIRLFTMLERNVSQSLLKRILACEKTTVIAEKIEVGKGLNLFTAVFGKKSNTMVPFATSKFNGVSSRWILKIEDQMFDEDRLLIKLHSWLQSGIPNLILERNVQEKLMWAAKLLFESQYEMTQKLATNILSTFMILAVGVLMALFVFIVENYNNCIGYEKGVE